MWPPGDGESPEVESIRPESGKRDETVKGNRYANPLRINRRTLDGWRISRYEMDCTGISKMNFMGLLDQFGLLVGCVVFAVSIYIETVVRVEFLLLNMGSVLANRDMEVGENWNYGGASLKLRRLLSILTGWLGAFLIAYSYHAQITLWGSIPIFLALLYVKRKVTLWRSARHLKTIVNEMARQTGNDDDHVLND